MDLFFKIFFPAAIVAIIFCFVMVWMGAEWDSKCREQGGIPVKGLCLKVDPSNIIKVVY